jgi:hypothetical protein
LFTFAVVFLLGVVPELVRGQVKKALKILTISSG